MKDIHPTALFRLSVLGPLVSRDILDHGERKSIIRELAEKDYAIPGSKRCRIGESTLESWYYRWKREGIAGLTPKSRKDSGLSKLSEAVQEAILAAKREHPKRSLLQLQHLMERSGLVPRGVLSRSGLHRLLQHHGLSRRSGSSSLPEEHRRFVTEWANGIWYGDVMHGPTVCVKGKLRKVYLVSLMDDASRLITHSAFCLGETALDIEGVLKQAVLKRGLPRKLVVDQGAAYRSRTLQAICARLEIILIYCRPYAPEGKGKLERWHRTVRDQFLSELDHSKLLSIEDLNARLWAWLSEVYHTRPHGGLNDLTPLERYQQDLPKVRPLGAKATQLDAIFYHRIQRKVRKDGTVSFESMIFEVPYELSGQTVWLVVDPHDQVVIGVESAEGHGRGLATRLDPVANCERKRRRPEKPADQATRSSRDRSLNPVELAYEAHYRIKSLEDR